MGQVTPGASSWRCRRLVLGQRRSGIPSDNGEVKPRVIEFVTDKRFVRRRRELRTLETMVRMYCEHHHEGRPPCAECSELRDHARRRLERCVFGDAKPTCANCTVHCYKADMRGKVRVMMRWAGPRMLFRHPIVAILHMIDGRRPAPRLPGSASR
jgi:hypothetical protein